MSIASQIARLQQAKADLKDSINNKGGIITDETISVYFNFIDQLPAVIELTQAQYDALATTELVWGLPAKVTGPCSSVGYNPIGTACSLEGDKMIVSGEDLSETLTGCYELTCQPYGFSGGYDENTYYLIVEEE